MIITFHHEAGPGLQARFAALAADGLTVTARDDIPADTEVIWHVLTPLTAALQAAAPGLRLIQKIGVGVNTIDLDAARARGIAVCNMPGTNSRAVAEMTLLLMLGALRRAAFLDSATRAGRGWPLGPALQDRLGEVGGRTVGLVGFGGIPRLLAPMLAAMGATVVHHSRSSPGSVPLDALLAQADIVSLHVPLSAETARLIDAAAIARMKPGAVLVNTARGGLVDEPALVAALRSGRLGAAGLDVFADEPVDPANPLLGQENVVVAPHVGWLTAETLARSIDVAAENCRRLRTGAPLLHRVA